MQKSYCLLRHNHTAEIQKWKVRFHDIRVTVKILKIGTPVIITIIVLQLERLDFTVQYCVQKMQSK